MSIATRRTSRIVYDDTQVNVCDTCEVEAPYDPGSYHSAPIGWIWLKPVTEQLSGPYPDLELRSFCSWRCAAAYVQTKVERELAHA